MRDDDTFLTLADLNRMFALDLTPPGEPGDSGQQATMTAESPLYLHASREQLLRMVRENLRFIEHNRRKESQSAAAMHARIEAGFRRVLADLSASSDGYLFVGLFVADDRED